MQKRLSVLFAAFSSALLLSACSGSIDSVKNGKIESISSDKTIGAAFDSYQYCTDSKWEEIKADQETLVRFRCRMQAVSDALKQGLAEDAFMKTLIERKDAADKVIASGDRGAAWGFLAGTLPWMGGLVQKFADQHDAAAETLEKLQSEKEKLVLETENPDAPEFKERLSALEDQIISAEKTLRGIESSGEYQGAELMKSVKQALLSLDFSNSSETMTGLVSDLKTKVIEPQIKVRETALHQTHPEYFLQSAEFQADFSVTDKTFALKKDFAVKELGYVLTAEDGQMHYLKASDEKSNDSELILKSIFDNNLPEELLSCIQKKAEALMTEAAAPKAL